LNSSPAPPSKPAPASQPRTSPALNAIAEHLDYGRRYTARTNQIQQSFEDTNLKQRVLELVLAASWSSFSDL
jgi:hypothetical protein